jgi:hypothetical protein
MEKTDELLGEGHYGKVYKTTNPDYVVKEIQNTQKTIASAQAECLVHQSLDHVSYDHARVSIIVPFALNVTCYSLTSYRYILTRLGYALLPILPLYTFSCDLRQET